MNVGLESFISRDIMYLLAKDAGYGEIFDKDNDGSRIGEFLSYVNNNSMYPVTIKYKNSSGRHEFFRYHHSPVNIAITGLSIDDPSKKGFVSDECLINFSVRCDFNTAGMYVYLSGNDTVFEEFENECINKDDWLSDKQLVGITTPQKVYTNRTLPNGWQVFTTPAFDIDTDERPYPLDFNVLLNTSLKEAISYHRKHGIPLTTFMNVDVLKNNRTMEIERKEYEIDWDKLILYVYNCNKYQEYRFVLSINTVYLNNLLEDIVKFREEK
jgi:hypothetical protein